MALPKGRLLGELATLAARAGIDLGPALSGGRRLVVETPDGALRLLLLRPGDVPVYVEYGVADVGVAGLDVLLESGADVVEPLDLRIGACRMVVAGPKGAAGRRSGPLRVASKYPRIAREHFRERGEAAVVVALKGSVELACMTGLADVVVDLVETGETLRANGLEERETVLDVTARLVVNRATFKTRWTAVEALRAALAREVEADG